MRLLKSAGNSLIKTIKSFRFAFHGLYLVLRFENNTRFHLFASLAVIGAGFMVEFSVVEWAIILTQIGLVWTAEVFNTAIEKIVDLVSPEFNPKAGAIKDIAAAAVLVTSIMAAIIGLLVFGNKIWQLMKHSFLTSILIIALGACSQSKVNEQHVNDSINSRSDSAVTRDNSISSDFKKKQLIETVLNIPDVIRFAKFENLKNKYGSIFIYIDQLPSEDIHFPIIQAGYSLQVLNTNPTPDKPCYIFKIIDYTENAAKVLVTLDMTGLMASGQLIYIDGRWIPDKNFIVGAG
ncbi:diacylglycerol kinase family protein [Rhodocytophaga rosea]|uniref:Diacylglycerol kinase family protein n=1 Tax=Rhodocytophaga rosea TaxID=2704465 RepID=A0A6C0GHZ1_9BACT|nr:diacylglycerol kinase family protein [Rhodocytophaga rosea]QHT67618.1 diacylglycerol kinase family protein [Rhodocytophaga rosea]